MKKGKILMATLLTAITFGAVGCGSDGGKTSSGGKTDNVAPEITVSGVPTGCKVGETVTTPAATATDNVDGDVSSNVKLTVAQLKADGSVNRELLYEKAGNVQQTFSVTSNTLLSYKILYTCKDKAGNKGERSFAFLAVADNETGTLVINESSVEGFSVEQGIQGKAGEDIQLPTATAIDLPDENDISNLVTAKLYEKTGDTISTTVFSSWSDFSEVKTVRIPAGKYVLIYSVKDAAGNLFETTYQIPITIAQPSEKNLIWDKNNFAIDAEGGNVNGRKGMSWINEYGELCFGNTSDDPQLDQTVGFTEKVTKIQEQYVGITFNADVQTTNGQLFYTMAARGSKDRTIMPNKETCTWPTYLFLRISQTRIESRVEKNSDKEMTTVKGYNGTLLDGKDHTVYVQWKNLGENATASDAAIMLYGWVDQTPDVGYENASFIFKAVAGDAIAEGVLTQDLFTEMWNETGAGWFSMDTYSPNKPHDDDHMRIKGFAIYDSSTTQFLADISCPVVSATFDPSSIFAKGEEIAIPESEVIDGNDAKCYITSPDGTKTEITGTSYTPNVVGSYVLSYEAYDEAGNLGYKAFRFTVAERDEVAPELTLSSETAINVSVGDEVILPTATANDNLEGNISSNIQLEIVGTEHITDLMPGGKYYPMTAGVQTIVYKVSDGFGNVATKKVTVNVQSAAAEGNILTSTMTITNGGKGLTDKEYIYDQKVSMLINISKLNGIIMINTRGPINNTDWPQGMVIRITNTNQIEISANGHDGCIYGSTSWKYQKFMIGCDVLFEYQNKNVIIDGVEYIRTQIFINGEALEINENKENGGWKNLEEGVLAIYRKLSDFNDKSAESIYSSPFWISAYNSSIDIKELRTDGTSCTKPADPTIPEGYEVSFGSGNYFITQPVTIAGGGDSYETIGQHSNQDYIAVNFNGEVATKGAFCLNITGTASGWSGGLVLRLSQDGFELRAGGPNATTLARYTALSVYKDGITAKEYTLVYKLTYIKENGYTTKIQVDVWLGEKGTTLLKGVPTVDADATEKCTYNTETDELLVSAKAFSSAEEITPNNITVVSLGALNGDCDWVVNSIEKLDAAPGIVEIKGYPSPLNTNAAEVKITTSKTLAANTDNTVKAVENVNENIVAVTFKYVSNADYYSMGINMLGVGDGWSGGLVLAITKDGVYFRIGGINTANVAQLALWSIGNGDEFTVAYKLTYVKKGEVCTAVNVEVWAGKKGETLAKVALHGTAADKCNYDAEKGMFTFAYDLFTQAQFVPDCTLIALQAFNDKDNVDCDWTITKVEILTAIQ